MSTSAGKGTTARCLGDDDSQDNVVVRLKNRLRDARAIGFQIRMEMLDGEQASWCEIAGVPTLFVDLSQTAAEQLHQVEEILSSCAAEGAIDGERSEVVRTDHSSNRAA